MSDRESQPTRKEQTHDRIVDVASRALRRGGYAGVGVADVMKEAGLTHGGFYAHFPSRDALLVEAVERAGRSSSVRMRAWVEKLLDQGADPLRAYIESYLGDAHLDGAETGCAVAALCSEMPRQSAEVREASSARVRRMIAFVQTLLPADAPAGRAGLLAGALVGTLQMARAVGSTEEGRSMLATARAALVEQYCRPAAVRGARGSSRR